MKVNLVLGILILVALFEIERRIIILNMNQAELAQHLTERDDMLNHALAEILARIQELIAAVQAAGNTTPEVDAAIANLDTVSQALEDVVPGPEAAAAKK